MRKVKYVLIFVLGCARVIAEAQHPPVFDKLNAGLRRNCTVCRYRLPPNYDSALLDFIDDKAAESFHKSHTALQASHFESAYSYAQRTVAALNDSVQHPLYTGSLFLWAKTNQEKGLVLLATRQYQQFLEMHSTDSVLVSDAYASLADLYVQQGDWKKAEPFLTTWQRYYKPFSDSKTTTDLFNNITKRFAGQPVKQLEIPVRIGTGLFTRQKDTVRLIRIYYNIAQWYGQQSGKKSAQMYLKRGLRLALTQRTKNYGVLKTFYRALYLLEKGQSQYKAALRYQKAYEAAVENLYQQGTSAEAFYVHKKLQQFIGSSSSVAWEEDTPFNEPGSDNRTIIYFLLLLVLLFIPVRRREALRSRRLQVLRSEVERLQRANESKSQLLSIIAHDLRSAVHALQVNIGKLKSAMKKMLMKDAAALADETEWLAGSTQSLLNNLLYWSLGQTNQISHYLEPVSLQPLLNGVCYDFLPLAASKSITLLYTLEQNFICTCDVNSFKIIFRNLIDNAIKYTPAGGTVSVSAKQEEMFCAITVQDTGIGMALHIIHALFTSDSTRIQQDASGRRSTGLGLWLAKNMAERNGGALHVSSVPDVGTAMTVKLPMAL